MICNRIESRNFIFFIFTLVLTREKNLWIYIHNQDFRFGSDGNDLL